MTSEAEAPLETPAGWLEVVAPGPATTLQDLGRRGLQRYGVPAAGALDPTALALANALVERPPGAPALEIRLLGPTLRAEIATRVALVGAAATLTTTRADGAVERVAVGPEAWRSVTLGPGDVLAVGPLTGSATAYLAVSGGFVAPDVFGSTATLLRAKLGGFGGALAGRALQAGDRLPLAAAAPDAPERAAAAPGLLAPIDGVVVARAVRGPQADRFPEESFRVFFGTDWRLGPKADRMGLRLEGPALAHQGGSDIVSDGLAPGSVQVPGAGLPIVLLADRQTAGGYAKIATVIGPDLGALGRARPGDRIRFEETTPEAAVAAARSAAERLAAALGSVAPAPPAAGQDPDRLYTERLYTENLITARVPEPNGRSENGDAE